MKHQFVERDFKDNEDNVFQGCWCEKCGFKVVGVPELENPVEYYPDHTTILLRIEKVTPEMAEMACEALEVKCQ